MAHRRWIIESRLKISQIIWVRILQEFSIFLAMLRSRLDRGYLHPFWLLLYEGGLDNFVFRSVLKYSAIYHRHFQPNVARQQINFQVHTGP
jgi:hypothetical protein